MVAGKFLVENTCSLTMTFSMGRDCFQRYFHCRHEIPFVLTDLLQHIIYYIEWFFGHCNLNACSCRTYSAYSFTQSPNEFQSKIMLEDRYHPEYGYYLFSLDNDMFPRTATCQAEIQLINPFSLLYPYPQKNCSYYWGGLWYKLEKW